ncbi:Regulator of nonsense transcripts 1-like [Hondaea fermentalgiana]|uniref:Regulator of nonsense transcripts 1-like n=1 Tax=Hondaea fermentalgiana TaxID=2315210 RepID=A0A2R5GEI2_9STRA|nr:Regulator of nonsense transcripts 1-like [Hondaea fermentalgiana]|eukprot:GBG27023.1 Regulator of nonsense transcripts 1-like [Hondaea fermentalgiana]
MAEAAPTLAASEEFEQDYNEQQQQQQEQEQDIQHQDESGAEADAAEPEELACAYCGVTESISLVQCVATGNWFCNGSGRGPASHCIQHLVRSRSPSRAIRLSPDNPLATAIECYQCSMSNVFCLGFVATKGAEGLVVLLCRSCTNSSSLKAEWNVQNWTPLVVDKSLLNWLVPVPTDEEKVNSVTTAQINRMEDLWKSNPGVSLNAAVDEDEDDLEPVQLRYEDGYHYRSVFAALVDLEAEYDREMKSHLSEDGIAVRWKVSEISQRVIAAFSFGALFSESMRVTIGDELKISLSPGTRRAWTCNGTVVAVNEDGDIELELSRKDEAPLHVTQGFSISFVWKPVTFERMSNALKTLAVEDSSLSGYLFHKLLGHDVDDQTLKVDLPARYGVKGLPDLNDSQVSAIQQALTRPLALIQGPPGTGKTVTSATLVYHMVKQNKGAQVLVTAPSNVAVDQLAAKIHQTNLKVVRLAAKSREHLDSSVEHLSLHYVVQHLGGESSLALQRLLKKREDSGNQLSASDQKRLMSLRRSLEREVLRAADVICCTCSGAADPRLAKYKFKHVLLDEATQATEPESLIPIVRGCKQFVLVGDHCQLGPVVVCKKAANAGLNSSLFERLVTLGLRPLRLTVQYRMHPCLSEFPSNTFYEGSLENGVSEAERTPSSVDFPWPRPDKPMMFFSCMGAEELASTGTSYLNRTEAANCERVVTALLNGGAVPAQIGVVTPYEGQRAFLVSELQRGPLPTQTYKEIEISSVDAFQGREKDFIILSCVRSNQKQGIGFLNDPRRLNVALTRAKYGLIILGNPLVLAQRPLWNTLLVHFRDEGVLVEGSLANLTVSAMKFPNAKKYYRDRRQRIFDENATRAFSGDVSDPFGERAAQANTAPVLDSRHDPRYGGARHQHSAAGPASSATGASGGQPADGRSGTSSGAEPAAVTPLAGGPAVNAGPGSAGQGLSEDSSAFGPGPAIPMPAISAPVARYKGFGDFDYVDRPLHAPSHHGNNGVNDVFHHQQQHQHQQHQQQPQQQGHRPPQQPPQQHALPHLHEDMPLTQFGGPSQSQTQGFANMMTQQPMSQPMSQSQSVYKFEDEDDDDSDGE